MWQEPSSCKEHRQMLCQYKSVLELLRHMLDQLLQRVLVLQLQALQATQLLKLAQMRVI
jgi:hypothetical protein